MQCQQNNVYVLRYAGSILHTIPTEIQLRQKTDISAVERYVGLLLYAMQK